MCGHPPLYVGPGAPGFGTLNAGGALDVARSLDIGTLETSGALSTQEICTLDDGGAPKHGDTLEDGTPDGTINDRDTLGGSSLGGVAFDTRALDTDDAPNGGALNGDIIGKGTLISKAFNDGSAPDNNTLPQRVKIIINVTSPDDPTLGTVIKDNPIGPYSIDDDITLIDDKILIDHMITSLVKTSIDHLPYLPPEIEPLPDLADRPP